MATTVLIDQIRAPRVSVLMPVRNGGIFLRPAIASILAQTMADFELIVVDDGSTDGTRDVLAAVTDPRLHVLAGPAQGIIAARNLALSQARGAYTACLDADDCAFPERLARQTAFLDCNPAVAVVGSTIALIDVAGRKTGQQAFPLSPADVRACGLHSQVLANPAAMMRTEVARSVGGYRLPFALGEDADLWLRIGDVHDIANLAETLTSYRLHGDQITQARATTRRATFALAACLAADRRAGLGETRIMRGTLAASCLAAAQVILGAGCAPAKSGAPSEPNGLAGAEKLACDRKAILHLLEGAAASAATRAEAVAGFRRLMQAAILSGDARGAWRTLRSSWRSSRTDPGADDT